MIVQSVHRISGGLVLTTGEVMPNDEQVAVTLPRAGGDEEGGRRGLGIIDSHSDRSPVRWGERT